MKNTDTRIYPFALAAGEMLRMPVTGDKFLIQSTSAPVNVRWTGGYLANLDDGQGYNVRGGFNSLTLTNDNAVAITGYVQIADSDFINNRIAGEVSVRNGAAYVNTAPAVGTGSAVLMAANAARTYLLIQNNDGAAVLSLNFSGAATMTNGLLIRPGGYYESLLSVHTGVVYAIADIATAKIIVVEG